MGRRSSLPTHLVSLMAVVALVSTSMAAHAQPAQADAEASCLPLPTSVTGFWPGDGTTEDLVGSHDAVLRGGASFGAGLVGQAFHLDGVDGFVEVPHDPALNVGDGDFTIALWVYFNRHEDEQVLVEKYVQAETETTRGWFLSRLAGGSLRFGAGEGFDSAELDLPDRTWIHITARRSGGMGAVFVDGQQVSSAPMDDLVDSESPLRFGHRGSPDNTPGSLDDRGFYLDGRVDEVEFHVGRALSTAEIQELASHRAGRCRPGAFSDVAGTTHEAAITAVAAAGIAGGFPDGTFRPGAAVTRGQMASFLMRALELEGATPPFEDAVGTTHAIAIGAVAEAGIAGGFPDGTFRPGAAVTRGQMASFLARGLGLP